MFPNFEYFNDSQKLTIVSFVLCYSKNHLSKEKRYQMPLAQIIRGQLIENSTNYVVRNIRFNIDITFWIKII